ncbi:MAG: DUF3305 domain-containing protein [Hyphomicrobiaceae bacterium]|nr:DUF3305 domain-containing protein [Hyphomicrobiaceae bacterium]
MGSSLTIPLGVVFARQHIDHPWQTYRWRPVSVALDALGPGHWSETARGGTAIDYHTATLALSLHRREAMAYRVNLANGAPSLYVVLREDPLGGAEHPVDVDLVTASPFEAQARGDHDVDRSVEGVAMPDELIALVSAFIDEQRGDGRAGDFPSDVRSLTPLRSLSGGRPPVSPEHSDHWRGAFKKG